MKWTLLRRGGLCASLLALTGCYTLKQGTSQLKLIFQRRPITDVIAEGSEKPERIAKLKVVAPVLEYVREKIGLTPGGSYETYIALKGPSVTYVVQAAEKRRLNFKTWWFPVIGSQPYLGFFDEEDAKEFRQEMIDKGYDTTLGGVQAFSLLGFFPDPLYSSMLDNNDIAELVEVLIHECVHRTVYVGGFSAFNENLADFVAKRATVAFLNDHPELGQDVGTYQGRYIKTLAAQARFKSFLVDAKKELEDFYDAAAKDPRLADEQVFLEERKKKFDMLADRYLQHMGGAQEGTGYQWAFRKGRINNATVLGYSLYEAKQAPFEKALEAAGGDLKAFMKNLGECLRKAPESEDELWSKVESCKGGAG